MTRQRKELDAKLILLAGLLREVANDADDLAVTLDNMRPAVGRLEQALGDLEQRVAALEVRCQPAAYKMYAGDTLAPLPPWLQDEHPGGFFNDGTPWPKEDVVMG